MQLLSTRVKYIVTMIKHAICIIQIMHIRISSKLESSLSIECIDSGKKSLEQKLLFCSEIIFY